MKTKVVNLFYEEYDVYIGRKDGFNNSGIYGNPFYIGQEIDLTGDGKKTIVDRKMSIQLYGLFFAHMIIRQDDIGDYFRKRIKELKGKQLGCFCKPKECHGDVIVKYLEEE